MKKTYDDLYVLKVNNELWSIENLNGKTKYIRAELWSEYDDNTIDNMRVFPDSIYVHTYFYLDPSYNEEKLNTSKIFFKTTLQLKCGENTDCLNVLNSKLFEEFSINEGSFTMQQIQHLMMDTAKAVNYYYAKSKCFALRKFMQNQNVYPFHNNNSGNGRFLNQIIIKTYYWTDEKKVFISEYIHPICSSLPTKVIIAE